MGLDLPVHPGDGGTPCHGKCRCHWEIEEDDVEWRAYWRTGAVGKICPGCAQRASEYAPYVQTKELASNAG